MSAYRRRNRFVQFAFLFFFFIIIVTAAAGWIADKTKHFPYLSANPFERSSDTSDGHGESPNHRFKIVIDPGHGGKDPGAEGNSGRMEKDYNLSLALQVYELLRQEPMFEPKLTRSADTFIELEDRAGMANDWGADALVSIHGNTYKDPSVSGTETYYRYDSGLSLAEAIHKQMVQAMGFRDRDVRQDELKVLTLSDMPAVLVEVGYLTNPQEEEVMLSEDGQARAAQAIVEGLRQFFAEKNG